MRDEATHEWATEVCGWLRRAVGRSPDAHPHDDEAVVRMGHLDCAAEKVKGAG